MEAQHASTEQMDERTIHANILNGVLSQMFVASTWDAVGFYILLLYPLGYNSYLFIYFW